MVIPSFGGLTFSTGRLRYLKCRVIVLGTCISVVHKYKFQILVLVVVLASFVLAAMLVFTARRYASAVLGVVILSVCPSVCQSVCHTRAL